MVAEAALPAFVHQPVLLAEVLQRIEQLGEGPLRLVDATVGGAGHATALLQQCAGAELVGIDRDPTAVAVARARLQTFGGRARVLPGRLSQLQSLCQQAFADGQVDFVLADLGVSSHQLDTPQRGFSFRDSGAPQPLDMRMEPQHGVAAWELIERLEVDALAQILRELGEERHARRLAKELKATRPRTTQALVQSVLRRVRPGRDRLHPATRTFQALRMAVNDELGELDAFLTQLPAVLRPGGIAAVISFHSLEDRAVKRAFAAPTCQCPPRLPICVCQPHSSLLPLSPRLQRPGDAEQAQNPRARSARLRAARRGAQGAAC